MTDTEDKVAAHYGRGGLMDRIQNALAAAGVDMAAAPADAFKPVDEFHIGGVQATNDLLSQIELPPNPKTLDIGSGIGGATRYLAANYDADATGVDLTPEYVETASALSEITGAANTRYVVGSALDLPLPDNAFDLATLLHVGMNIEDKSTLMKEARRVLKPGGVFAVYEVMRAADASDLIFPLPWAETPDFSFVDTLETYQSAARAAGFEVVASRGRKDFAIEFFKKFRAALAQSGPPPLGLHLLMGDTAAQKVQNMLENITADRIEPTELILRAA